MFMRSVILLGANICTKNSRKKDVLCHIKVLVMAEEML